MRVLAILAGICACFESVQARDQPEFFPQLEHSEDVNSAVFSPEPGIFASCSNKNAIKLYNTGEYCPKKQADTHERRLEPKHHGEKWSSGFREMMLEQITKRVFC
jgi:WD40 repeat protein